MSVSKHNTNPHQTRQEVIGLSSHRISLSVKSREKWGEMEQYWAGGMGCQLDGTLTISRRGNATVFPAVCHQQCK